MTDKPANTCVWFEIPVTDLDRSKSFYETVLGTTTRLEEAGPNPAVFFTSMDDEGVSGHLYPGKPSPEGTGNTIHLGVPAPLEDAMGRVPDAGGKVVSDIIDLPAGRFVYCLDPDGNSIGLFSA